MEMKSLKIILLCMGIIEPSITNSLNQYTELKNVKNCYGKKGFSSSTNLTKYLKNVFFP